MGQVISIIITVFAALIAEIELQKFHMGVL